MEVVDCPETKPITEVRYVFDCEWYDQQADIVRFYRLTFFPNNNSIEMYDKKMHRPFIKRVIVPQLNLSDIYEGAKVTIFSRVMQITGYCDVATGRKQTKECESTFAMIKPDSYQNFGKILDAVQKKGFVINRLKMSKFSEETSNLFYEEHIGKEFFPNLQTAITSDVCVGMELISGGAIDGWREFVGPTNSEKARQEAP